MSYTKNDDFGTPREEKCSPIEIIQIVPGPNLQGESKSEYGNFKFSPQLPKWIG